ncbi:MAG TPA: branched-chain amino acid ABC transporter permease [Lichenihabitans sp.]|jgi:branched-subunit amino acid ABC-type transport system permease component|nr:branched-chain amino acid ABC transporter permease [Lichenihabitans sp.]
MTQILVDAIIYAAEIAIIAMGVALSFSILRFANFAHVQFAVVGAYLSFAANQALGLPLLAAVPLGVVATGLIAVLVDRLVFSRLKHIAPEGKMIVSWGVALVLRASVAAIFGGASRVFPAQPVSLSLGGAYFTSQDAVVVGTTLAAMVALRLLLYRTRAGTALRALASNADLAETRGIPAGRMIALMWFVSGAYAALGGTMFALETRLQPNMDLIILLPTFAAVTIGGLDNVFGAALGALALSLAQNLLIGVDVGSLVSDTPWSVPTQFRDFVAVGAMVLILLLRRSRGERGAR